MLAGLRWFALPRLQSDLDDELVPLSPLESFFDVSPDDDSFLDTDSPSLLDVDSPSLLDVDSPSLLVPARARP